MVNCMQPERQAWNSRPTQESSDIDTITQLIPIKTYRLVSREITPHQVDDSYTHDK